MPSRLKGIETFLPRNYLQYQTPLYMPSRLKGIETTYHYIPNRLLGPLYMPSRLKGIETYFKKTARKTRKMPFVYAFPFEGN